MFKNLKTKKNEEKLMANNELIKEMVTKCELLINSADNMEVKEAVRVLRDEITYLKLSSKNEAKTLEKKISNGLDDLRICINKKEKAIGHVEEIMKLVKERDIIA